MGLDLALHQATRSEKMVNIFHAAGHTVGIDTLRRIEQNGYIYIPNGISPYSPGRIILSSFDNIDVLEETTDGENTLNAPQCVLWQRGPRSPPEETTEKKQEEIEYLIRNYLRNFTLLTAHLYTLVQGQIQS